MFETFIGIASQYGVITAMFVWLLYTTNSRNEDREKEYQQTIEKNQEIITDAQRISLQLSEELKTFTHMSGDIKEIKDTVTRIKERDNL